MKFIELINNKTGALFSVNTNHIVSIWSERDHTGTWDVTYCVDVLGDIYKKPIAKESFLKLIQS